MKKNIKYGFIALAALAMTGCSNDELDGVSVPQQQTKSPVEFSVYMPKSSRGTVIETPQLQDQGFGIMGYYIERTSDEGGDAVWKFPAEIDSPGGVGLYKPNFMNNQFVNWNGSAWEYSPLKYWPTMAGDNVSFLAYAPYEQNPSLSANKNIVIPMITDGDQVPCIRYKLVPNNPLKMKDLLTAFYSHTVKKGQNAGDDLNVNEPNKVNFNFQHTLSRLAFAAKLSQNMNPESFVNITSFKILGNKSDKLSESEKTNNVFYESAKGYFNQFKDFDAPLEGNGATITDKIGEKWSWVKRTQSESDYSLNKILNMEYPENMGAYFVQGVQVNSDEAVNIFRSDADYLFLIPAHAVGKMFEKTESEAEDFNYNSTGIADGELIVFELKYDVVTCDPKLTNGYSKVSATKLIKLKGDINREQLEQGKAYKYTLIIDVDDVQVDASVNDWNKFSKDISIENPAEVVNVIVNEEKN